MTFNELLEKLINPPYNWIMQKREQPDSYDIWLCPNKKIGITDGGRIGFSNRINSFNIPHLNWLEKSDFEIDDNGGFIIVDKLVAVKFKD